MNILLLGPRPRNQDLPKDVREWTRPEEAAIPTCVPVISHQKDLVLGDDDRPEGPERGPLREDPDRVLDPALSRS